MRCYICKAEKARLADESIVGNAMFCNESREVIYPIRKRRRYAPCPRLDDPKAHPARARKQGGYLARQFRLSMAASR